MKSIILLIVLVAPASEDQARALYQAGTQAYDDGRYEPAIEAFEEVLLLAPRPAAQFSAAQAHRLQYFVDEDIAHLERAVELYRAYLGASPEGRRREHAAKHLANIAPLLERRRAQIEVGTAPSSRIAVFTEPQGASVTLDGAETLPAPVSFEVEPGVHRLRIEAPNHIPIERVVQAEAGLRTPVTLTLRPRPAELKIEGPGSGRLVVDDEELGVLEAGRTLELPPGPHLVVVEKQGRTPWSERIRVEAAESVELEARLQPTFQRKAAWGLAGTGAALALATAVTTGLALDAQSTALALDGDSGFTVDEADRYMDAVARRDDFRDLSVGLGIGAGVALAGSALLWIFDQPQRPKFTPSFGVGGGGVRF
ncbi:MAG: PEGA domain-containing protein [Myxococcota bacterium]